jgi:hypothetical protein
MSLEILFESPYEDVALKPKPSLKFIPEAYKKMHLKVNYHTSTVKKCIPVLDALTCGYIIPLSFDILFHYDQEKHHAHFDMNTSLPQDILSYFQVEGHANEQLGEDFMYNKRTINAVFKFASPWTIKTPSGYSCIFTQPFNRNLPFKIIDGIVDTDTYEFPIKFPFYWTAGWEEDLVIKAGTPMVLVIPFKREEWKFNTKKISFEESREKAANIFRSYWDSYKNKYWNKKSFK